MTTHERRNLLRTIGILTSLLIEEKSRPLLQHGNKPYQIAQTIIEKAQAREMDIEDLKSIDRKIREAFKVMEEDT